MKIFLAWGGQVQVTELTTRKASFARCRLFHLLTLRNACARSCPQEAPLLSVLKAAALCAALILFPYC